MANNAFSYGKCWNFGKMVRSEVTGTWKEMWANPHWIEFRGKHMLTDAQIYYIKRGFMGKPMEDTSVADQPNNPNKDPLDDEIFPFGTHKGKKFAELPNRYITWLIEQEWIEKWPMVHLYAKRRSDLIKENTPTKEEIKQLLSLEELNNKK